MYVKNSITAMKRYFDSIRDEILASEVGSEKYSRLRKQYFRTIKSAAIRRKLMFWKKRSLQFANIRKLTQIYTEKMFPEEYKSVNYL